jgi:hypothetical protein
MALSLAARVFEFLLGLSLLLQSLEYLTIQRLDRVGDWAIQRAEVPQRPRWIRAGLDQLFKPLPYQLMLWLRLALALALMAGQLGLAGAGLLFVIALALLLRWRGAFNGGSDFMTLVGLTGLLMAHALAALGEPVLGWRACLWYVSLQAMSSYFVSGWVKLLRPEWRSGRALSVFLDTGIYGPLSQQSVFHRPRVARACAWAFTVWEGCFPLALLDLRLAIVFCSSAAVFHGLVFWYFGLNRFFWAWLSTFPALLYCAAA